MNSRAMTARRSSGRVGRGGGPLVGRSFLPPTCGPEPQVLEIGEGRVPPRGVGAGGKWPAGATEVAGFVETAFRLR